MKETHTQVWISLNRGMRSPSWEAKIVWSSEQWQLQQEQKEEGGGRREAVVPSGSGLHSPLLPRTFWASASLYRPWPSPTTATMLCPLGTHSQGQGRIQSSQESSSLQSWTQAQSPLPLKNSSTNQSVETYRGIRTFTMWGDCTVSELYKILTDPSLFLIVFLENELIE